MDALLYKNVDFSQSSNKESTLIGTVIERICTFPYIYVGHVFSFDSLSGKYTLLTAKGIEYLTNYDSYYKGYYWETYPYFIENYTNSDIQTGTILHVITKCDIYNSNPPVYELTTQLYIGI